MKHVLILFLLSFYLKINSQNINGLWAGEVSNEGSKKNVNITFPIAFEIKYDSVSNSISGISRTINFDNKYSNAKIQGSFNREKNYYYVEETEITETNHQWKDSVVKNYFTLRFKNKNKLSGECFCINKEVTILCNDNLIIRLKRKSSSKKK